MNTTRTREWPPRTVDSAGNSAAEKDAIMRRQGELHRLLNSRKGSLNATYKTNAEANYRAYDLNQKTMRALDALAERVAAVLKQIATFTIGTTWVFDLGRLKIFAPRVEVEALQAFLSDV